MKYKNGVLCLDHGSVRYMGGEFYDTKYNPVFTPFSRAELNEFMWEVERFERKIGGTIPADAFFTLLDTFCPGMV